MSDLRIYIPSFLDELTKISAATKETRHGWSMAKSRNGNKSMSVDTLLRKEKDSSIGGYKLAQYFGAVVPFTDSTDRGAATVASKKMPGYIPSRDEVSTMQAPKNEDGRDFAATVLNPSTIITDIGAVNRPSERTGD